MLRDPEFIYTNMPFPAHAKI